MRDAGWRKASYSNSQGACVEVGSFRKSTHSSNTGQCVEAGSRLGVVGVRDTKDGGTGPVLEFGAGAWGMFLAGLR
jgi:Domain of unknown function (DUF397)